MSVRIPTTQKARGTLRRGELMITGTLLIGAAGALTSFVCEACATGGIVKTAAKTGRYTVTLLRKYRNPRFVGAFLIGPTDVGLTGADGNKFVARNLTGQTFDLQAVSSADADANPTSGNSIHFTITVQEL